MRESFDCAFRLVFNDEEESKFAESLDTCTEFVKSFVQGIVQTKRWFERVN